MSADSRRTVAASARQVLAGACTPTRSPPTSLPLTTSGSPLQIRASPVPEPALLTLLGLGPCRHGRAALVAAEGVDAASWEVSGGRSDAAPSCVRHVQRGALSGQPHIRDEHDT
jgi:hypothetical protein